MAKLSIDNIITVTLTSALKGLANINTSVLALITSEEPIPADYGDSQNYLSPDSVATDWGSNSTAYRLAQMVFSQTPNILTGGGYLTIIPRKQTAAAQPAIIKSPDPVDLTALTAEDYHLAATVNGAAQADYVIGPIDTSSMAAAQASLNSYDITDTAGLEFVLDGEITKAYVTLKTNEESATASIVLGTAASGTDIALPLGISGSSATGAEAGLERIKDAILRTADSIPYFGVIIDEKPEDSVLLEIAKTMQTYDKLLFVGSSVQNDIAGIFTTIMNASLTHTRCLYYSLDADDALDFAAGYAGRGMSINFDGANTALTMHLKTITRLTADAGLTQTLLTACKNAGVDIYGNFGVNRTFTSGANLFFDQIYTRLAFKTRVQVAGFNFLATTNTKIPQTEEGMNGLKKAYRAVCSLFVSNGTFAPGEWLSSTTYGDPETHKRAIEADGYYVYSSAVADQSETDRTIRKAPVVYIACKDSGAIHSSDVTVSVES